MLHTARYRATRLTSAGVHRTYVGRLERGESGVTVDSLAAILAALGQPRGVLLAVSESGAAQGAEPAGLDLVIRPFPLTFAFSQLLGNAIAVSALDHRRSKASRASRASSGRELASWILAVRCRTGAL